MNQWQILLDVIMVLVIVIIVLVAIKRGFVKSFFRSTKLIIVILITSLIGSLFVGVCRDYIVNDLIEGKITQALVQKAEESGDSFDPQSLHQSLPAMAQGLISQEDIEGYFESLEGNGIELAQNIGIKIEEAVIDMLSNTLAYLLTFIGVYIICTILVLLLEKFCTLPVLNEINKILGCVWGLSIAYIVVSVTVVVLDLILGNEFIEGTVVTRVLYNIGLFTY